MRHHLTTHRLVLLAVVVASGVACTAPGGPDKIKVGFAPPDASPQAPDGDITSVVKQLTCNPIQSSQPYPPRASVTSGQVDTGPRTELTETLFARFKTICGGCHVDAANGNFIVSKADFSEKVDQHVVDVIVSPDDKVFMPPKAAGGVPFDTLPPTAPLRELVALLRTWIAQGRPDGVFMIDDSGQTPTAGYEVSATLGSRMTNIGTCVPGRDMVGSDQQPMDDLDAMFAKATELPDTLDKTDLVTLDSAELAKRGVISFAPTYPLWTENAGKMRYVRVPRGQTITFDKATQQFKIPANTRFYKTFLKEVVDVDGHLTWRKMETRVIVSRPDQNGPDGRATAQTALYGTYVWSADETTATLLADPLRNGKPFVDRVVTYITDEEKAKAIEDGHPKDLLRELKNAGLVRHYALPGALRCVACHMGSPSQSFILGFTPLQLARRSAGVGGLYEPVSGDELTQVQRLIDYGVVSGMTSAEDILPLELTQGSRVARTSEELNAQAYMLGNCAHCHNPRGFPSVNQPLLVDKLNFLPSPTGGIFQFPLDRFSPVRHRGLEQDVPIPYITPSLYDQPRVSSAPKVFCPNAPGAVTFNGNCLSGGDPLWILAPWRSLIYRNVETPFDYFEDYVPYPHMPLHSPGFDCRAPRIIGDWMVSIPAELIDTTTQEEKYPNRDGTYTGANEDLQPYREVTPDNPNYQQALAASRKRLDRYHASPRYSFCPATYTDDIVDPVVAEQVNRSVPVSSDTGRFIDPNDPTKLLFPELAVPIRPNYIAFDDTDVGGPWFPRNALWDPGLVDPAKIPEVVNKTITQPTDVEGKASLTQVLEELQKVTISDEARAALLQELPSGLWDTSNPKCDFSKVRKVADFQGAERPAWMDIAKAPPMAPVFVQSAGAAVFTTICYNCHGVLADSKGVLSGAIVNLTGGDARVANFRDGLFGPLSDPGANRTSVFKAWADQLHITPDDLAVRYVAYMALGGTQKHLPVDVLTQVAQTPIFGKLRSHLAFRSTANMLQIGLALCGQIATADTNVELSVSELREGRIKWSDYTGLIDTSGDAEMWLRLCSLGNRPIVRVPDVKNYWTANAQLSVAGLKFNGHHAYFGDTKGADGKPLFPATAPVMDHRGRLHQGLTADNPFPVCVEKPTDPTELGYADAALKSIAVTGTGAIIPYCPPGFVTPDNQLKVDGTNFVDGKRWAARGAINAAMAVFLYLDQIERDPSKRQPLFNHCEQLGAGSH
jgi:mono/diheme cytochrome c family protein